MMDVFFCGNLQNTSTKWLKNPNEIKYPKELRFLFACAFYLIEDKKQLACCAMQYFITPYSWVYLCFSIPGTPQNQPACPPGEVFYECKPTCRNTCENKDSRGPCTKICVSGCSCPTGFVRRKDGICIRPRNCPIGE